MNITMKEINTKELKEGAHIGKEFWVCDYRFTDFNNKPIRHVKPTKVLCRSISETKNRVYYSDCFFSEIKKDKVVNSSIIKLFDNTGYRSYSGIPLKVFKNEEDCITAYRELAFKVEEEFEKWEQTMLSYIQNMKHDINKAVQYERN